MGPEKIVILENKFLGLTSVSALLFVPNTETSQLKFHNRQQFDLLFKPSSVKKNKVRYY